SGDIESPSRRIITDGTRRTPLKGAGCSSVSARLVSEQVDDEGECRVHLATARIVEMKAGEGLAPVVKHRNERAGIEMGTSAVFGDIGNSKALKGCADHRADGVERELSVDLPP